MTKNINLVLIFLILTSCGGFKLKKTEVDEFLVEKKSPLVLPPDYGKLPLPDGQKKLENNKEVLSLKDVLSKKKNTSESVEKQNNNSSIEKSILDKIK
tara:strand:- start:238 stop:531 length:294 start_codon:yes stop_codon:yes gene_type:complete